MRTVIIIILAILIIGLLVTIGLLAAEVAKPVVGPTFSLPTLPPTVTPPPTPTLAPTPTIAPSPTPIPTPPVCPPVVPTTRPTDPKAPHIPVEPLTELCGKHGQVVWEINDKGVGQKITFGNLDECCWTGGWIKVHFPKTKIWFFAVPPKTIVTFQSFHSGKAWFVGGNRKSVEEFQDQLANNFRNECKEKKIDVQTVVFPDDCNIFPFLSRYQSRWPIDP